MHELSICQQLMIQVNEIASQHQASAVDSITLKIGPLAGIDSSLLKQAFPFAAADSIAEKAQLIIQEAPLVIQCKQCGSKTNATANKLICGECGDYHTQLLSGDEMLLVSVELNSEEQPKNMEANYV